MKCVALIMSVSIFVDFKEICIALLMCRPFSGHVQIEGMKTAISLNLQTLCPRPQPAAIQANKTPMCLFHNKRRSTMCDNG